ncbi:MAG TPA: hypothetical protein VMM36_19690 [Opitutaceae bacterium]|nr:hypothetical protein [Opitutaceae bacterium]
MRIHPRRATALVCFVASLLVGTPSTRAAEQPNEVTIGTLVNRIDAISLRESTFDVDFYIWFVWSNPEINPGETFEIVNGRINSKAESDIHDVEGGRYACYRVQATIIKEFDLFKYPRDRHHLTIEIEDATSEQDLVYTLDSRNSMLSDDFYVSGFTASGGKFDVTSHIYNTNYGDPNLASDNKSVYSRFIASFGIHRPSSAAALKLYIGVFAAALIGFLSLLARADQADVRFGLGSAALFAAIATQFVIATNMPETSILTVPDLVCIATISSVFLTLLASALGLSLCNAGKDSIARKIDVAVFAVLPAAYFILCAFWVFG